MTRARTALDDRTVLITGAARGIGEHLARRLHAANANVALVGLEPERLQRLRTELGDRVAVFDADVTDATAITAAADATAEQFGGIDIAVANAGVAFVGALATAPVDHVERTLQVNLMGVWRTDRAVLPHLIRSKGYLLNISFLAAAGHMPLMGAYTASKAGSEALIDTDLVRGSLRNPAGAAAYALAPSFLSTSLPVTAATDALEKGIARRSARIWAPRFVGPALAARGLLQPLVELGLRLRPNGLSAALALADDQHNLTQHDTILGAAGNGD